MSSLVRHITFDAHNAYEIATFWAKVVDGHVHPDDKPEDDSVLVVTKDGADLLFEQNPDDKTVKNRVHFDLQPTERTRDDEVAWLQTIGATIYNDHRRPDGTGWVTMHDPEGNEFCVERGPADRRTEANQDE
ncbi:VOC family protein [Kribbella sp. NBC_01245]|uniref:VOC family protein n=1 Tax=Kribbella sp. NBC_01245 TaxID=2903578 RepID=UPI002E2C1D2D|nr:VOC family protein [Kribbella sp. NBC_01245]